MNLNQFNDISHTEASACGKTILLGEHSAVYGHKALALGLNDIRLKIKLYFSNFSQSAQRNCDASALWTFSCNESQLHVDTQREMQLKLALQTAFEMCKVPHQLRQSLMNIEVNSQIPLGGGMGGSAALSVALVKAMCEAMCSISKTESRPIYENINELSLKANAVDGVFHGVASGLDVAAVCNEGAIEFERGQPVKKLKVGKAFWLALIDSNQRTSTQEMVSKVKEIQNSSELSHKKSMNELGQLAVKGIEALENGQLQILGHCMSHAHTVLKSLQVSTTRLDELCAHLDDLGAMGSKLTGGGGGGLVLGLFDKPPQNWLPQLQSLGPVYHTFVRAE